MKINLSVLEKLMKYSTFVSQACRSWFALHLEVAFRFYYAGAESTCQKYSDYITLSMLTMKNNVTW